MLKTTYLRSAYPERAGFSIVRKQGHENHTFLHFFGSVELLSEGKIIKTEPHACILYPQGTSQYFLSKENLTHDWIHFTGDLSEIYSLGIKPNTIYYVDRPEFITKITQEIEVETRFSFSNKDEMLDLKLKELFILLQRGANGESLPIVNDGVKERLRALRGEIFTHPNNYKTVGQMAEKVYLSESRFYFLYKSFFGVSPMRDLIEEKINSAKNALLFTDAAVVEIAETLGYDNVTHFIRQFKKETGFSPSSYRKKFR